MKRRTVLKLLSSTAALGFAGMWPLSSRAQARGRVVVVGGGFGGATAARYLRLIEPSINVTLVEPGKQYITFPMSNDYTAGERDFARANTQAKVAAQAIVDLLRDRSPPPSLLNACFSLIEPKLEDFRCRRVRGRQGQHHCRGERCRRGVAAQGRFAPPSA